MGRCGCFALGNVRAKGAASVEAAKRLEMMTEARILVGVWVWVGFSGGGFGCV